MKGSKDMCEDAMNDKNKKLWSLRCSIGVLKLRVNVIGGKKLYRRRRLRSATIGRIGCCEIREYLSV